MTVKTEEKNTKRIDWIDIARGICIILMIVCHYCVYNPKWFMFNGFTGLFFLVFFFFCAGVCFDHKSSFSQYFKKQLNKTYIPYLIVSSIIAITWIANGTGKKVALLSIIYGYSNTFTIGKYTTLGVGPIWFLSCFFVSALLYKAIDNRKYKGIYVLLLAIFSKLTSAYFVLPFSLQSACNGLIYIWLGDVLKKYIFIYVDKLKSMNVIFIAIITYLSFSISSLVQSSIYNFSNGTAILDLGSNLFSWYTIPSSLVSFIFLINISVLLERNAIVCDLLKYYGRNSFIVLMAHSMDIMLIRNWANRDDYFLVCTIVIYGLICLLIIGIKKTKIFNEMSRFINKAFSSSN